MSPTESYISGRVGWSAFPSRIKICVKRGRKKEGKKKLFRREEKNRKIGNELRSGRFEFISIRTCEEDERDLAFRLRKRMTGMFRKLEIIAIRASQSAGIFDQTYWPISQIECWTWRNPLSYTHLSTFGSCESLFLDSIGECPRWK